MVTLKHIPNLLSDKGRRSVEVPFDRRITLRQYLEQNGFPIQHHRFIVTDRREVHLDQALNRGDEVIVTPVVAAPVVAAVGLAFQAIGAWVAANAIQAALIAITIGYSIYQAVQKPKLPSFNLPSGSFEDSSPTYAWDGIRTLQGEVNVPIPVAYGRHRLGGNIINQFVKTDGEKQYLYLLLALCEGEIESIENIEINDNPIGNFASVETQTRLGTNDQTAIPGFEELHQISEIGAQVLQATPYIHTTVETELEAFEVQLSFPIGIYVLGQEGDVQDGSVQYKIEYRVNGTGPWTDLGVQTVTIKSRTKVVRIFRKDGLTPAKYDIRVTRISADSTFQVVSDLYLDQVDEITLDDLQYPNVALLAIKALANEQLSGSIPKVTAECNLRKVRIPNVTTAGSDPEPVDWQDYYWDPDAEVFKLLEDDTVLAWDGETYIQAWSANPVWCVRDLILNNRYGLGEFIDTSQLNEARYLEMAKYAEEKVPVLDEDGGTYYEKRFRLDVVIDGLSSALDLLVQLSAVFRGMPFYSNGMVDLYMDKPDTPVQLFGMGNIVQGSFQQKWTSKREKYNVIECSFLHKDRGYRQETIAVIDEDALAAGQPRRTKQLRLLTTYPSIALRESRYALAVSRLIDRALSFKAGIDAITCHAGQVIRFSHDVPVYGFSGRVLDGSTTSLVILSRDVTIEPAKTYKIQVRFQDDTVEERTVSNSPETTNEISVSAPFSQVPQAYDVFAFGESNKVSKPYRVIGITKESNHEVALQALEYVENVYDESAVNLPANNFSALGVGAPNVTDLNVTERLVKLNDGTIEVVLDVWWQKPSLVAHYVKQFHHANVYLSINGGVSWEFKGASSGSSFSIVGGIVSGQTYRVAVVSVDEFQAENPITFAPKDDITTVGKTAPPSDVESFVINIEADHLAFQWEDVQDVDLGGYEIRQVPFADAPWDIGIVVDTNIQGTKYSLFSFSITTQLYYAIKAIDTSGNYSENPAYVQILVSQLQSQNIVAQRDADFDLGEIPSLGSFTNYAERVMTKDYNPSFYRQAIAIMTSQVWGEGTQPDGSWDTPIELDDAVYITENFDLGASFSSKISLSLGVRNTASVAMEIEIAYGNSADPTNWEAFVATNSYAGRYFRFRLTFSSTDANVAVVLYRILATFDVPDRTQEDNNVAVAGTGWTTITLDQFTEVRTLLVTVVGNPYVYEIDDALLPASFAIRLFDTSAVQQAGAINYFAKGF